MFSAASSARCSPNSFLSSVLRNLRGNLALLMNEASGILPGGQTERYLGALLMAMSSGGGGLGLGLGLEVFGGGLVGADCLVVVVVVVVTRGLLR